MILTPQRLQSTARRLLSTRHTAAAIEHSVKRKQALVSAGPVDNAGAVTAVVDGTFNLSSTIFKTLPKGSMLEKIQLTKLDALLTFEPQAQADIEDSYQRLRPTLQDDADAALFHFMETECSFDTEHADGSFLEHLAFCREYCALHFPAGSSRVMLLHSICGVGTNAFPMSVDKLPQLASMLSAEEMAQVQAFPSILRLLVHGPLLDELAHLSATDVHLIRFHRVLDNVLLELSMPQFWQALNYQLIHVRSCRSILPICWLFSLPPKHVPACLPPIQRLPDRASLRSWWTSCRRRPGSALRMTCSSKSSSACTTRSHRSSSFTRACTGRTRRCSRLCPALGRRLGVTGLSTSYPTASCSNWHPSRCKSTRQPSGTRLHTPSYQPEERGAVIRGDYQQLSVLAESHAPGSRNTSLSIASTEKFSIRYLCSLCPVFSLFASHVQGTAVVCRDLCSVHGSLSQLYYLVATVKSCRGSAERDALSLIPSVFL